MSSVTDSSLLERIARGVERPRDIALLYVTRDLLALLLEVELQSNSLSLTPDLKHRIRAALASPAPEPRPAPLDAEPDEWVVEYRVHESQVERNEWSRMRAESEQDARHLYGVAWTDAVIEARLRRLRSETVEHRARTLRALTATGQETGE